MPLTARLEPWQRELCSRPEVLSDLIDRHGSPVNVLSVAPFARNVDDLRDAAERCDTHLDIFFARKANKGLCFVDEARRLGLGVDVASEAELTQTLDRGVPPGDIIVTAAVKPRGLLERCVVTGVAVALDNLDEMRLMRRAAEQAGRRARVAVRIAPDIPGRPRSRFGFTLDDAFDAVKELGPSHALDIAGIHFHVDGYLAQDRVTGVSQAVELVHALRRIGHRPTFIDIGGGIPMSYLDDGRQWSQFWGAHRAGLLGTGSPVTYGGHGLGLTRRGDLVEGSPNVYPYWQSIVRGEWLMDVLQGRVDTGETVASELRAAELRLRCEPGRAILDGCGMTLARVEFRKPAGDGLWLIGCAMNRTQCRSTSDDFMVDPLLVPCADPAGDGLAETGDIEGYLVGAYCIERELLTWRRLRFPDGVRVGDIIAFPNTAGYLMHILESASHQIPLARTMVMAADGSCVLDPIEYM
jgi:diaminopimelate decarboxylase